MIEKNEKIIEALRDGRITGLRAGSGPSDPQSVPDEIDRLTKKNEEHRSLLRLDEAFQRRQRAYLALNGQWLPHGNGLLTDESVLDFEAAEEEFRAA